MKSALLLVCLSTISCLHPTASKPQVGIAQSSRKHDSYSILARAIQSRVDEESSYEIDAIASALRSLSKAQATLKKIDGTGK
jgi:outer membrane PBP1 activator LpoA protein